jgi:hypothetical protein
MGCQRQPPGCLQVGNQQGITQPKPPFLLHHPVRTGVCCTQLYNLPVPLPYHAQLVLHDTAPLQVWQCRTPLLQSTYGRRFDMRRSCVGCQSHSVLDTMHCKCKPLLHITDWFGLGNFGLTAAATLQLPPADACLKASSTSAEKSNFCKCRVDISH